MIYCFDLKIERESKRLIANWGWVEGEIVAG